MPDALVGAELNSDIEFELEIPDDDDYEEDVVGRKIKFMVEVKKIELVTLPDLNDDFAARVTKEEDEPLTLLQLRLRMRENLQTELKRRAKSDYSSAILDEVV